MSLIALSVSSPLACFSAIFLAAGSYTSRMALPNKLGLNCSPIHLFVTCSVANVNGNASQPYFAIFSGDTPFSCAVLANELKACEVPKEFTTTAEVYLMAF